MGPLAFRCHTAEQVSWEASLEQRRRSHLAQWAHARSVFGAGALSQQSRNRRLYRPWRESDRERARRTRCILDASRESRSRLAAVGVGVGGGARHRIYLVLRPWRLVISWPALPCVPSVGRAVGTSKSFSRLFFPGFRSNPRVRCDLPRLRVVLLKSFPFYATTSL